MARKNANGLTELQQAVADAFLLQPLHARSAAEAYRSVRPKATARTCEAEGSRILSIPDAAAYVADREKAIAKQVEVKQLITTEEVIGELKHLALADLPDVLTWDAEGNVRYRASDELDARGRAAVKGIKMTITERENRDGEVTTTKRMELVMHDKVKPLELLGKYKELGLFTEKVEHSGEVGGGLVLLPAAADGDEWQRMAKLHAQQTGK